MKVLLPNDLQLQPGNRKRNILLWIVHSNQFHNTLVLLPKRMDCYRIVCRNMYKRNIRDGNAFRWHSNNRPGDNKIRIRFYVFKTMAMVRLFTLILAPHLSHGGARYFSKQYSQYKSPFSSTKPISASGRLQLWLTQTKWSGHQMRPRAVMNGPLKKCLQMLFDVFNREFSNALMKLGITFYMDGLSSV